MLIFKSWGHHGSVDNPHLLINLSWTVMWTFPGQDNWPGIGVLIGWMERWAQCSSFASRLFPCQPVWPECCTVGTFSLNPRPSLAELPSMQKAQETCNVQIEETRRRAEPNRNWFMVHKQAVLTLFVNTLSSSLSMNLTWKDLKIFCLMTLLDM